MKPHIQDFVFFNGMMLLAAINGGTFTRFWYDTKFREKKSTQSSDE